MSAMTAARVRFAPSPTGLLHLGGLRTALFNFLLARSTGGSLVLRIEDTDQSRVQPGAAERLMQSLAWAKIQFDEGPGKLSPSGPFVQSQRLDTYQAHTKQLLESGHAYKCYCTESRLDMVRKLAQKQGKPAMYDRHCRHLSQKEHAQRTSEPFVVRFKMPTAGTTTTHDLNFGASTHDNAHMDDYVLLKSDGYPTYHLASVVDDSLMRITHVMRGDEWLPSTPKHLMLYQAFNREPPAFVHLPLLVGRDGKKLSKRDGATGKSSFVERFQEERYDPDALNNFVALLGWSPPAQKGAHEEQGQEVFSMRELIERFDLGRLHHSPAVVDYAKLDWIQKQHFLRHTVQDMPAITVELRTHVTDAMQAVQAQHLTDEYLSSVVNAIKTRVMRPHDIVRLCGYFWLDPSYDTTDAQQLFAKVPRDILIACLQSSRQAFGNAQPASSAQYTQCITDATSAAAGASKTQMMTTLRLAVTGTAVGASVPDTLATIGHDRILRRIDKLLDFAAASSR